jgi:hypothetical protein
MRALQRWVETWIVVVAVICGLGTTALANFLFVHKGIHAIHLKYLTLGGRIGFLGHPTSEILATPALPGLFRHFEGTSGQSWGGSKGMAFH